MLFKLSRTTTVCLVIAAAAGASAIDVRAQSAATNSVTGGATKGSFKLPDSDSSVTLGGYVKLDAIYSDRSAGVGSAGNSHYLCSRTGPTIGDTPC